MSLLLAALFGYLLGSIPFGLILTRAAGGPDVRTIGSGNIGATNVLRTGRKGLAAATLLCDMLKGTAAVLITAHFASRDAALAAGHFVPLAAGLGAFIGHLFPVWLKFKGGKGVATYIGVLLGLVWPAALIFGAIWLVAAWAFRYSSLSALIASAINPLVLWFLGEPGPAALYVLLTAALWIMHRANIARLMAGTEGKIGAKA
jgi:glycerol-3-phosphate acyltransferase PlsY